MKNTVAIGDGWGPIAIPPDQLRDDLRRLRQLCDEAGRDPGKIEITVFSPVGNKDPRRAVAAYAEAGAHRLILFPSSLAPDQADRELEGLAKAWMV